MAPHRQPPTAPQLSAITLPSSLDPASSCSSSVASASRLLQASHPVLAYGATVIIHARPALAFMETPTIAFRKRAGRPRKGSRHRRRCCRRHYASVTYLHHIWLLYTSQDLAVSNRIRVQVQDRMPPNAAATLPLENRPPRVTAAGETAPISSFPGLRRLLRRRGA